MEAFSLLKFWRGGGSAAGTAAASAARSTDSSAATTTILTAVAPHFSDSDSETASDSDGPFFDLEFTAVPDEEDGESKSGGNDGGGGGGGDQINGHEHAGEDEGSEADDSDNEEEEEGELNLTFSTSSASSVDRTDPDVSLSPSDDLFFKGRLVPVESSSLLLNETEANSKFPVSLVKTATKFRVLMLKLKKPKANAEQKPEKSEPDGVNPAKPSPKGKAENEKDESQSRPEKKFFTVRFKVEEVNIKSLFTRDNSSKNAYNGKAAQKTNAEDSHSNVDSNSSSSSLAEEKKFSKEMMQKYLKMVKPLYIRVSKRYGEKLRFSGQLSLSGAGAKAALVASPPPPPPQPTAEKGEAEAAEVAEKTAVLSNVKSLKQGNLPAGLRVVRKHLRKSRSAPSPVVSSSGELSSRRRDDSLLQQQDGIQSAILHCKRSFNTTRDSNLSILSRTTSDASHEKPINLLAVADDSSSPKEVKPQSGKLSI
ncbi:probable membrane-associated kinase regulator 2 [Ipomoea triloba]|uniref:probable membrane-associated kinase regulator 2 n=1 Tax=Ipomoea triloba TaxID=35885 RepID=UPI00125DEFBF|nr:probable membrane-associated kinase regulator 2 [Ipomoea triloba]